MNLIAVPFKHRRRLAVIHRPSWPESACGIQAEIEINAPDAAADHLKIQGPTIPFRTVYRHREILNGPHKTTTVIGRCNRKRNSISPLDQVSWLKSRHSAWPTSRDRGYGNESSPRNNITHATDATQRNINRRDRPNRKKGYQKSRNDRRKNSGEHHSIQC